MGWVGLILTVIMGLAGVPLIRDWVCARLKIDEKQFSTTRIALVLLGAIIAGIALYQKSQEAAQQKHTIDVMRKYSVVARLTSHGVTGIAGAGLKETPDPRLEGLKEGWMQRGGKWFPVCNDPSLQKARQVIIVYPEFPWAYYHLALCLRARGDLAWKEHAERAIQIFEYTTSIADHNSTHDQGLKELRSSLIAP